MNSWKQFWCSRFSVLISPGQDILCELSQLFLPLNLLPPADTLGEKRSHYFPDLMNLLNSQKFVKKAKILRQIVIYDHPMPHLLPLPFPFKFREDICFVIFRGLLINITKLLISVYCRVKKIEIGQRANHEFFVHLERKILMNDNSLDFRIEAIIPHIS